MFLPDREFLQRNKIFLFVFLSGLVLISFGALLVKKSIDLSGTKVEVLEEGIESDKGQEIVVEVEGAVEKPGVYKLTKNSRIEDVLILAGGFSGNADRSWIEKNLNRAQKLSDGQKIYIPRTGEQSNISSAKNSSIYQTTSSNFSGQGSGLININTASLRELDSLPGIGQVYAQNIIEHRPYSTIEELLSKNVLKASVYEKIKSLISTN